MWRGGLASGLLALGLAAACEGRYMPVGGSLDEGGEGGGSDPARARTYSRDVAPLVQLHCQGCHRPGGDPPSLMGYADAAAQAQAIRAAVASGSMPAAAPLLIDSECSPVPLLDGPRRLTEEEIDTFVAWVDAGAYEGNPADLPPPVSYPTGEWQAGAPDAEYANDALGFAVPPGLGRDIFRRFALPTSFDADRWITSFEVLPGEGDLVRGMNGRTGIIHHVKLFIDAEGASLDEQAAFQASDPEVPGPGYEDDAVAPGPLVGVWFPGGAPLVLAQGTGVPLPQGAALVVEVHYSTYHTEAVTDVTRIGLRFAPSELGILERRAQLVRNEDFTVRAGDAGYRVIATTTLTEPRRLDSVTPHMGFLGTEMVVAIDPELGSTTCLGRFAWDYDHEHSYALAEPRLLEAGTRIQVTCTYDNTAANPAQFNDPPADVPGGRTTDSETCQLFLGLVPN